MSDMKSYKLIRMPGVSSVELSNLAVSSEPKAVAIGNFDGVHLGHQTLLAKTLELAEARSLVAAVMVFEPQPLEFFSEHPPVRLMRLEEKVRAISLYGISQFIVQKFNHVFAHYGVEQFAQYLNHIGCKVVVVGEDFRFGHQATGDVSTLAELGREYNFEVMVMPPVNFNEIRISSSGLRAALAEGDIQNAATLLGRPYSFWGRVGHGDKMGRSLGFPTINLVHKRKKLPLTGVYASRVMLPDDRSLPAVANVGVRPTVNGLQARVEAYILDFDDMIYGQKVQLCLLEFIRAEQKFNGLDALKDQIARDIETAKNYFKDAQ
jgi:riboflavin kinase/FMN adenylyltransferase